MLLSLFHYGFEEITVNIEIHSSKVALRLEESKITTWCYSKLIQVVYPVTLRSLVHAIKNNALVIG